MRPPTPKAGHKATTLPERIAAIDWASASAEIDTQGWTRIEGLLSQQDCQAICDSYHQDSLFRSHIVMGQHGFGGGEYKYFNYPLPGIVATLRERLYASLVQIANKWRRRCSDAMALPDDHPAFLEQCRAVGQRRPTALVLRYQSGDYNRLHQDLYGDLYFPLQVAILLSRPCVDFTGGEFVLTEHKPRSQSRADVVPLEQGDAAIFAVNARPMVGARGTHTVRMRHGVSRVRSGTRFTLGVIFHDAQ